MNLDVDHLLVAAPDLEAGRDYAEAIFGIRPVTGGVHPGQGTRNALLGLENDIYVEIIAPDPAQSPDLPLARYLATREAPALRWWCARCDALESLQTGLADVSIDAGRIEPWSRQRPDGGSLRWRLLIPAAPAFGAVLPFFISWDDMSAHPSRHVPVVGSLSSATIQHPAAERLTMLPSIVDRRTDHRARIRVSIDLGSRELSLTTPDEALPGIGEIMLGHD